MRILHVATLFTPDGAYGGPTRVALNQCEALSSLGHEVHLTGGYSGYPTPPQNKQGVTLHLFPVQRVIPRIGFAGLTSVGLLKWVTAHVRDFDLVHVHLARDLVTLPAARIARMRKIPFVTQTHGMIDPSRNPLATPLDLALTRPTLRKAETALYLTDTEASDLHAVAGPEVMLERLTNGVPVPNMEAQAHERPEVLFLARLHARKRPTTFVIAAQQLSETFPQTRFTLVGPDEGEAGSVRDLIGRDGQAKYVHWEGPISPEGSLQRMARASIYVLPSIHEPYPMTVLEAMSLGIPVIVTNTCGLAPDIQRTHSGLVVGENIEDLTDAIHTLLDDHCLRQQMGVNARQAALKYFAMDAIASRLESIYERSRP